MKIKVNISNYLLLAYFLALTKNVDAKGDQNSNALIEKKLEKSESTDNNEINYEKIYKEKDSCIVEYPNCLNKKKQVVTKMSDGFDFEAIHQNEHAYKEEVNCMIGKNNIRKKQ